MEIILPDNFKDLSMLGMQELILNHNYGITSYVFIENDNYNIILLLFKRIDNNYIDLLSSYKTDLVLNNIDKNEVLKWLPYQERLKNIIRIITNKSYEEIIRNNIVNYFKEYLRLKEDRLTLKLIGRANELAKVFRDESLYAMFYYNHELKEQKNKDKNTYENKLICQICGGKCCLDSSCDYIVSDIKEFSVPYIRNLLDRGLALIKAIFYKDKDDKLNVLLVLRTPSIRSGKIDLVSIDSKCAHLGDNGCTLPYENRPGFARHLIPSNLFNCYNDLDIDLENRKWVKYQDILEEVIYEETGKTKEEELSREIEIFFCDVLKENFEGITTHSIKEAKMLFEYLCNFYQDEYLKSLEMVTPKHILERKN